MVQAVVTTVLTLDEALPLQHLQEADGAGVFLLPSAPLNKNSVPLNKHITSWAKHLQEADRAGVLLLLGAPLNKYTYE